MQNPIDKHQKNARQDCRVSAFDILGVLSLTPKRSANPYSRTTEICLWILFCLLLILFQFQLAFKTAPLPETAMVQSDFFYSICAQCSYVVRVRNSKSMLCNSIYFLQEIGFAVPLSTPIAGTQLNDGNNGLILSLKQINLIVIVKKRKAGPSTTVIVENKLMQGITMH